MQDVRNIWDVKNWGAFKERYNIERNIMTKQERIDILDSRVGVPTARVMTSNGKWIYFHSSIDPVKEAQKIANTVSIEPGKIIVVYGFGLGYLVDELLKMIDESNLIFVIEPDYDLFQAVMGVRDLRYLISSSQIHILLSESTKEIKASFFDIYDTTKYSGIAVTSLLGHQAVYSEPYHQSMQYIKDVINTKLTNLITMIKMGSGFVSNTLLNLVCYCSCPGVNTLFNKLEGKPAIIVAAGPSLNKNIHLLKEAKGKAAILAVGTALKALKKWDIEPDFVFSIDPQPLNYNLHFKGVDVGSTALIAEIQSNCMIFENYQGPIFVAGDMPILGWFKDYIEDKGRIETGGSVANNAFVAAYKMGANPIVLVGQDLAYSPEGNSHASGTSYENQSYSKQKQLFPIKANDGRELLTDRSLYQYLTFFQLWIENHPDREYINATEGGAYIQGTKIKTLQTVLNEYCQETIDIQGIIKEAQKSLQIPEVEPILKILELRLRDTNQTIAGASKAIQDLAELGKACENREKKKMQKYLKAVGRTYEKFAKDQHIREVAEWFAPREIQGVVTRAHEAERSENDSYSDAIADYTLYYKKIIDGSKSVKDLLQRCIEKFRSGTDNDK